MDPQYLHSQDYLTRYQKLEELRHAGVEPYPHHFTPSCSLDQVLQLRPIDTSHTFEEAALSCASPLYLAGRLILMRPMGKSLFAHIQDDSGRLQLLLTRDQTILTGYHQQPALKKIEHWIDLGDLVGVSGELFYTHKGELTLWVKEITLLAKALLPLPDKHSGLTDKQLRYRKRSLDLISHPEVVATFKKRSLILRRIRTFFEDAGFMEVETPILQNTYGGAQARPFTSYLNALEQEMFLRISLEIPLKKLLVGGLPRIFEMGRIFRNEGIDRTHNPEFTMLEAYALYWDYHRMMELVEHLFETLALDLHGTPEVLVGGEIISFRRPWRRMTMIESIENIGGIPVENASDNELRLALINQGLSQEIVAALPRGLLIQELFELCVEDKLIQPTHIIDHPIETTPLCKPHREARARARGLVERFESFIAGGEICNAYSELNDPVLQRELFQKQVEARLAGDEEAHPMDEEFLETLCHGMAPAGGIGIGIDRLVMLLTGEASIRDVLFFPLMRPYEGRG